MFFFTKKVSIEVLFDPESNISQRNPFLSRVDLSHLFLCGKCMLLPRENRSHTKYTSWNDFQMCMNDNINIYIHRSYIPKMHDFGKICVLFQAIFLGGDIHGTANPRWSPNIPLQRSFQENVDNWELENCGHWMILRFCLLFCRWKKPMNVMNVPVLGGFSKITSSCGKRKEMVLRNNLLFCYCMFKGDIHPNPRLRSQNTV